MSSSNMSGFSYGFGSQMFLILWEGGPQERFWAGDTQGASYLSNALMDD